jgi:hypothetical protein
MGPEMEPFQYGSSPDEACMRPRCAERMGLSFNVIGSAFGKPLHRCPSPRFRPFSASLREIFTRWRRLIPVPSASESVSSSVRFRFFGGARIVIRDRAHHRLFNPSGVGGHYSGIQPGVASHPGLRLLNPSGVGTDPVERIPSSWMDSPGHPLLTGAVSGCVPPIPGSDTRHPLAPDPLNSRILPWMLKPWPSLHLPPDPAPPRSGPDVSASPS